MGAPELTSTASLQITPELLSGLQVESRALVEARDYTITDAQSAVLANSQLQDIKRRQKTLDEWDERFAAPIRQLEATRKALFGPAREALAAAEGYLKGLIQDWNRKELARVAEAKQKALDEARRRREQAERDAAAARARAEAEAAEARRKADEAAKLAEEERKRGNARAAAAAEAERARLEEAERQKREAGERKAAEIEMTASAATVPAVVEEPVKLDGFSERKNWICELAPETTEDQAQERIVRAICGIPADAPLPRADLLKLVPLDLKAAAKLAKALESKFNVPGLKARNAPVAASRGK